MPIDDYGPPGYDPTGRGPRRRSIEDETLDRLGSQKARNQPNWSDIAKFCSATLVELRKQSTQIKAVVSSVSRSSRELDRVIDSLQTIRAYARRAGGTTPPSQLRDWVGHAPDSTDSTLSRDPVLEQFLRDSRRVERHLAKRSAVADELPPSRTDAILDLAEEILTDERGRPVYYKHLADEIRRRGGPLPESDRSAYETLIRMMNADVQQRFKRPYKRGYYALAKDHPGGPNVGARDSGKGLAAE